MSKKTCTMAASALLAFAFSTQALAQGATPPPPAKDNGSTVAPPPPVPAPVDEPAPQPKAAPAAQTSVVAPPSPGSGAVAPASAPEEISGPPSDLPYYVPQGAERLPSVEAPAAVAPPAPPSVQFGVGPLFRYHVTTNGLGGYAEIGGVFRFSSTGVGLSTSVTAGGGVGVRSLNFGFESPILTGILVYQGPVTVGIVPRFYAQLAYYTDNVGGGLGMNAGAIPSVQVAGCQGIPWYFNAGAHLTANLYLPTDGGDPQAIGTVGPAIEAGVLFF